MRSIRGRLLVFLSAGFAALLAATGLYVLRLEERRLTDEFDEAMRAQASSITRLAEWEPEGLEWDYDEALMPQFGRTEKPDYFELRLHDGTPLPARSGSLAGRALPFHPGATSTPVFLDVELPDGRAGRIVHYAFVPRSPDDDDGDLRPAGRAPTVVIALARSREDLDALLGTIRRSFGASFAVAVALALGLVWFSLAAGLRPLREIARQVGRLDADSLGARVSLARTPSELAPIVDQLNALLARLEASFDRERRFTGNVAHELRTPIAELRSLAEVGGAWPDDRASVEAFFRDVHGIAGRMESLVVDLLLLARCQAGVEPVERRPVLLSRAVDRTWSSLGRNGSARTLRRDVPADLEVRTDPGKLDIILTNLLDNALAYAPQQTEIRCVATRVSGRFRLEISNAAEPLTPDDLAHLAEPFWRKDEARASETHAGLGLSLVTALSGLLRIDFRVRQDDDGTFRASLEGPLDGGNGAAP